MKLAEWTFTINTDAHLDDEDIDMICTELDSVGDIMEEMFRQNVAEIMEKNCVEVTLNVQN